MTSNRTEKGTEFKVIGVAGMPGSGKGEVCRIAGEEGVVVKSLGDAVRKRFFQLFPDGDPKDIGSFANIEREKYGEDIWARRLAEDIGDQSIVKGDLILIDGIRSLHEVSVFKELFGDSFLTLCIHSSPGTRYGRLKDRMRGDDPVDPAEFAERDRRELGWGLGDVIAMSDFMLVNEGSLEELEARARDLLKRLIE